VKKLAFALGFIVLGVLLTLGGLYLWLESRTRPSMTEEEIRQKYVQDYTREEQRKLGIDCRQLKPQLRAFLESKVRPVITARQPGQNWDTLVSDELKREVASYRQFVFTCLRLYEVGDAGRRNALEELSFALDANQQFMVIDILLRLGASQNCHAQCLDNKFMELQSSYEQLLKRLS